MLNVFLTCCFKVSAQRNLHLRTKPGLGDAEILSAGIGEVFLLAEA